MTLESEIVELWHRYDDGLTASEADRETIDLLDRFLDALEAGEIRAAVPRQTGEGQFGDSPSGRRTASWAANEWVKQGILLNFGLRETEPRRYGDVTYHDVLPLQDTADLLEKGTRNTPDGTVIRRGAHIGENAIMMSPSFVNVGAHVGDGTLIDSCDTIGSCAQIGSDVKIGANVLIGGVLEPVEDAPVVIEDSVSLGAGCRVTSGFVVGANSVVGENTLLTPRIPVYDLVADEVVYGHLPPERRAFVRYVESSVSDSDLFEGPAYKPAVVATDVEERTLEATQREDALRE